MHDLIRSQLNEIVRLCARTNVRRLDLFGSALGDDFAEGSDVDFLVEFGEGAEDLFGSFFALKEGLEDLLGRPVDLITVGSIRNPYFERDVMASKESLYAA